MEFERPWIYDCNWVWLDKKENILQLLSCADLPKLVDVENLQIQVTFLTNAFGFFS